MMNQFRPDSTCTSTVTVVMLIEELVNDWHENLPYQSHFSEIVLSILLRVIPCPPVYRSVISDNPGPSDFDL